MAFTKITNTELHSRGATTLPDVPTISASALKQEFDAPAKEIVAPKFNNLIDELEATTAASGLGIVTPEGRTGNTVQAVVNDVSSSLASAETAIDTLEGEAHTHDNKALLDTYTQTEEDLASAVSTKHTHANKAVLDKFTESSGNVLYNTVKLLIDAFSKIKVGNRTLTSSEDDTVELVAGTNMVISADESTKKITFSSSGGSGGGSWGAISGNIEDQQDLQDEFALKANLNEAYVVNDTPSPDLDDADTIPFYDTSASEKKNTRWDNIKAKLQTLFDGRYRKKIIATFRGEGSSDAYCLICTIVVQASYVNGPTEIVIQERGRDTVARLNVAFQSTASTDPQLSSFIVIGAQKNYYIAKTDTSTWQIYVTKNESYSFIDVVDCSIYNSAAISVTWNMTNAASLPSGAVQATMLINSPISITRTGVTVSADGQVRIPASGTDSRISNANTCIINPICQLKSDGTPYKFKSCEVSTGYATITLAEAISNVEIGVLVINR